jgi:hypothetical protein
MAGNKVSAQEWSAGQQDVWEGGKWLIFGDNGGANEKKHED